MSPFTDKELMDELDWLIECLEEDKIKYKASLNINSSDKRPYVVINNGRVTLTVKRVAKKLLYTIRDEDEVRHARLEGFTEQQINENIKCCHMVDQKMAELIITNPTLLADSKTDAIKEATNTEENT